MSEVLFNCLSQHDIAVIKCEIPPVIPDSTLKVDDGKAHLEIDLPEDEFLPLLAQALHNIQQKTESTMYAVQKDSEGRRTVLFY